MPQTPGRAPVADDGAVSRVKADPKWTEAINHFEIASNATQVLSSTLTLIVPATRTFG